MFKIKLHFVLITFMILIVGCESKKQTNWKILSPDRKIQFNIQMDSIINQLFYSVQYRSDGEFVTVIESSPLGITRKDEDFVRNLSFIDKSKLKVIDEEYSMLTGKQIVIQNRANEVTLSFKNNKDAKLDIIARAYNDGFAFKYHFPEKAYKKVVINEATGFKIPLKGKAWIAAYDTVSWWAPAYETYYEGSIPIGMTSPNPNGWSFPALFEVQNCWVLLSEANLTENYCAMHIQPEAKDGLYTLRFPEKREAEGLGESFPTATLPWETPWRMAIIGNDLSTIVESNMVNNLSEPSTINNTDWIIPGKSSWSWWSENASPGNYNILASYIDFSKDFNLEYSLVDAGWNTMKGGDIKQLAEYAQTKGVGLWMWYNSGGPNNKYQAFPRDLMYIDSVRQKEFEKIAGWGVKGVKVDFFQSDKQDIVKLYLDILKDAAKYKLMVDFHGCTLPRGWSRTYPNLLSMEAVKGEEVYRFGKLFPEKAPAQNTILAFTRNVVGSMDYTPVGFSDRKYPHLTTWSHEVALSVLFESGIIHLADGIGMYTGLPEYVKGFLKQVPAAWDETKFISGYPGKYVVLARRKGDTWFIGGINGENISKTIEISLAFLTNENWNLNMVVDGADSKSFSQQLEVCNDKSKIKVDLLANGGFSGVIFK